MMTSSALSRFERLQNSFRRERESTRNEYPQCKRVIQSSFQNLSNTNICPSSNGFVRAAFAAYSQHHHLSIRPEDVWFSILSQLSFYINAHAEDLRSSFVAHSGQTEVTVVEIGTIETVNIGKVAVNLTHEMHTHLADPTLRSWLMPTFTTTTETDTIVAAVIMMGSLQAYFKYTMGLSCGIPSVTLLGARADWVDIRRRIDRLAGFGDEAAHFSALLVPVLDNFVRSFDAPADPGVVSFWQKIAHRYPNFSGPEYLSGWITAFCFWDAEGKRIRHSVRGDVYVYDGGEEKGCEIDGVVYHLVDTKDIPDGYVSVPVKVDDNGLVIHTRMVAGLVGIEASSSGENMDVAGRHGNDGSDEVVAELGHVTGLDSLQPVSGWWMYELDS